MLRGFLGGAEIWPFNGSYSLPTFEASTSGTRDVATEGSVSVNVPTHIEGDLLLAFAAKGGASADEPTPDDLGWIPIEFADNTTGNASLYYRICGASEPASYSWTNTGGGRMVVRHSIIRGYNPIDPINTVSVSMSGGISEDTPFAVTGVSTTQVNCLIMVCAGLASGSGTTVGGTDIDFTGVSDVGTVVGVTNTNGIRTKIGRNDQAARGASASVSVSYPDGSSTRSFSVITVAIAGAPVET